MIMRFIRCYNKREFCFVNLLLQVRKALFVIFLEKFKVPSFSTVRFLPASADHYQMLVMLESAFHVMYMFSRVFLRGEFVFLVYMGSSPALNHTFFCM